MSGLCKDCRHWMRAGMLAQRGTGGRVLRAACSNHRSILYRGQMTPSSLGCPEFEPAALHTLLRHEDAEKLARETAEFRVAYLPAATGETTGYTAHTGAADPRF
jgi:hypothetical protein